MEAQDKLAVIKKVMNAALTSKEKCPIVLDEVWEALGYSRKDHAVRAIVKDFVQSMLDCYFNHSPHMGIVILITPRTWGLLF
jgi:hypothetical protein